VSDQKQTGEKASPVIIKKYANRRLYNTATSAYVTLEDLAAMVKAGSEFVVHDAKTGEDLTRQVLTQIIFEEENNGTQNLLPITFLRNLIRFYGDQMQGLVPGYLDLSINNLMKEQDKFRNQIVDAMGLGAPSIKGLEEQAKRNMTMFNDAMKLFNPFAMMMGQAGAAAEGQKQQPPSKDELQSLKDQLTSMQEKLDRIAK